MAKQYNITYFLGAGASFHAIPIAEKFNNILHSAIGAIDKSIDKIMTKQDNTYQGMLKLRNNLNHFSKHADKFNTIDTYAKKLFLKDDKSELSQLKTTISLFFTIWQQLSNKSKLIQKRNAMVTGDKYEYIDHRYITLLSSFLKRVNTKIVIDDNINFISWNYDLQIEMAVEEFIDIYNIDYIIDKYSVYPNIDEVKNPGPYRIVHLNGIAGIYETKKKKIETLYNRVDKNSSIDTLMESLSFVPIETSRGSISNDRTFSYAWEDNTISQKAIKEAARIMSKTDVLVIIGYSFPAFNKDIDKKLFMHLVNNKRLKMVYYQVPDANKELLKNRFNIPFDNITPVPDVGQFEIPLQYL